MSEEQKHTAGRLAAVGWENLVVNTDDGKGFTVALHPGRDLKEAKANAARIAACWNACEGLNPEGVPCLVKALLTCRRALKDHVQYDDGNSLEREAYKAADKALTKAGVK